MSRWIGSLMVFAFLLGAMTVVCTVVWDKFVAYNLYDCTDSIGLDYLHPGDWIHSANKGPVAVPKVTHTHTMSEPDSIKEGWTVEDLWLLWFAFFGTSLAVSALLTWPLLPSDFRRAFFARPSKE